MSDMVCIPRTVFDRYWPRPFSEILAAAERGADGLTVRRPHYTPARELPPRRENYTDAQSGAVDEARYRKDCEKYDADQNVAFMYEADRQWSVRDKAILWQQNWNKA